ncbi:hypothetical protein ISF_01686 [Cordyceps fumosorosea ARSEF 2679]|uniref:Uncharacterized protein n=1 Tax=Cordyceps fumosorosea (strain ARSEF 2679) TaxID=1081104 RepID=A0A168CA03_CORFA|nr:hypothetical protein ISF_01686 [Cordyceps fumosorosea ARSEF 2679]OAA71135.1 hypothetical protein ISF_01686 [Cordyceps fumosorosea ARSEF 2679]
MGIEGYFKVGKSKASAPPPSPPPAAPSRLKRPERCQTTAISEKPFNANDMELQAPTPRYSSRPGSTRSNHSTPSNQSPYMLDEIKHEVMVITSTSSSAASSGSATALAESRVFSA